MAMRSSSDEDRPSPIGTRSTVPFLRSPPFPETAPTIAAIGSRRTEASHRTALSPAELIRAGEVIAALVAEKVGGAFWSHATDPWRSPSRPPIEAGGDEERGFVAWLRGTDVTWTSDGLFADYARDGAPHAIERAVTGLLIDGIDYRDPFSGELLQVEGAIAQLGAWRRMIERNQGLAVATGIKRWKQREVEAMLWPGDHRFRFERSAAGAVRTAIALDGAIAVWPTRAPRGLDALAAAQGVQVIPVEDGFMRSAGLGSDLYPPHSIIVDRSGLHFDPRQPSDLEKLIAGGIDDPHLLARAERLRRTIVEGGISKYASSRAPFAAPATTKPLVLVAGQVVDDLSVRLGGAGISSNLELIRRARAEEPDAFLIFKPHPDVDAGHRKGKVDDGEVLQHADLIVRDVPMASLLDIVARVHILTSLTGFEALMRNCEVVTHGQPFFAGWGLTRDLAPSIERRRGRTVTITELVAATLIEYPRYLDPVTKLPCTPELLVERLMAEPAPRATLLTRLRQLQGRLRRALSGQGARA
jgi:capsular polysaccharide export protein